MITWGHWPMPENKKDHYSYTVYAAEETAENFENKRFGGPIGSYMRELQERQLEHWLPDKAGLKVLDIGAGTGRTAIPLASAGAEVVAADASEAMLKVAERNAAEAGVEMKFSTCDVMDLPFSDREFEATICLRVLMHVTEWRQALREICRCCSDRLILDYPPRWALASLQVPVRAVTSLFDKSVQRFRLFSFRRIRAELEQNGFTVEKVEKLWVLPIAFHKLIRSRRFTGGVERILAAVGMRKLFGAPVTVLARRSKKRQEER